MFIVTVNVKDSRIDQGIDQLVFAIQLGWIIGKFLSLTCWTKLLFECQLFYMFTAYIWVCIHLVVLAGSLSNQALCFNLFVTSIGHGLMNVYLTHCPFELQPHTVHLNHHTLKLLKYWTWQFVIVRPVCSILMITLQVLGTYPSWVSWTFTIILNISVSVALYSLVLFYHVFAKELEPHKPLAKFLCVKGIVFFCFWQVCFSSSFPPILVNF